MPLTNRELIERLEQYPLYDEVTLTSSGIEGEYVTLEVGNKTIAYREYGINDTHLAEPGRTT